MRVRIKIKSKIRSKKFGQELFPKFPSSKFTSYEAPLFCPQSRIRGLTLFDVPQKPTKGSKTPTLRMFIVTERPLLLSLFLSKVKT